MTKENSEHIEKKDDTFVQIPRRFYYDLVSKIINTDEYLILSTLWLATNPYNGKWCGSYRGLEDLFGKRSLSENRINKAMLELKRKKYLWFDKHQGRSSFEARLNNYPLTNKTKTDINGKQDKIPERVFEETEQKLNRSKTELFNPLQKLEQVENRIKSRSSNNDNDKENNNNNNKISIDTSFRGIDVNNFTPNSWEEERCREYALKLEERDMKFILSALKKYGLGIVQKAYDTTMDMPDVKDKRKYFNKLVQKFGEEESPTETKTSQKDQINENPVEEIDIDSIPF